MTISIGMIYRLDAFAFMQPTMLRHRSTLKTLIPIRQSNRPAASLLGLHSKEHFFLYTNFLTDEIHTNSHFVDELASNETISITNVSDELNITISLLPGAMSTNDMDRSKRTLFSFHNDNNNNHFKANIQINHIL